MRSLLSPQGSFLNYPADAKYVCKALAMISGTFDLYLTPFAVYFERKIFIA
jgi:hypothetical protein